MSTEIKSVFDVGYVSPNPKLLENGTAQTAFLLVAEDSKEQLEEMGFSGSQASGIVENGYANMLVHTVTEQHTEGFSLQNTLSDTIYAFATGAVPVSISVTGHIKKTPKNDDFVNFLKLYSDKIRGRILDKTRSVLYFGYKDTIMRIYILNFTVGEDSEHHGYVDINFSAAASHYRNMTPVDMQGISSAEAMPDLGTVMGGYENAANPMVALADATSGGFAGPLGVDSLSGLAAMSPTAALDIPGIPGGGDLGSLGLPAISEFPSIPEGVGDFMTVAGDTLGTVKSTVGGAISYATDLASTATGTLSQLTDAASEVAGMANSGIVTLTSMIPSVEGLPQVEVPDIGIPSINSVKWV